jgi:hypothetical protein
VPIHLPAEHAREFELAYLGFEPSGVALDLACGRFIADELGELEQLCGVAQPATGRVELPELRGETCTLAAELLGALGIAPDGRILELEIDLFEAFLLAVVLKETPSRRSHAPRDLSKYA